MKRILAVMSLAIAAATIAAPPLFDAATESKWLVSKGAQQAGSVTLLTSKSGVRAEWRAAGAKAPVVFLGSNQKIWVRESGGDVELSAWKGGAEKEIVAALLYADAKAKYTKDAKGASEVQHAGFVAKRTSLTTSTADASNFVVRPKKSATSRLARLSGDLLGPSQSKTSATAGGRGVGTKGLKLNDGGDYAAVEAVENRDAAWSQNMDEALAEFHKQGKVGKGRDE